jgi:hypothetical protein
MANKRIWWALHQVKLDGTNLEGVQSVGVDISVAGKDIIDWGQLELLRYCQDRPEATITIERFLPDPFSPLYFDDASKNIASFIGLGGSGSLKEYAIELLYEGSNSIKFLYCLLTELSYSFTVDGKATESSSFTTHTVETGEELLAPSTDSGDIVRRHKITGVSLPYEVTQAIIPDTRQDGTPTYVLQSFNISTSIGYGEMIDYGKWYTGANQNKWKYLETPIETTCEISAVARSGNLIKFSPNDYNFTAGVASPSQSLAGLNTSLSESGDPNRSITISAGGKTFDLGSKNYLTATGMTGGDTGGGNAEVTFGYSNRNYDLYIT